MGGGGRGWDGITCYKDFQQQDAVGVVGDAGLLHLYGAHLRVRLWPREDYLTYTAQYLHSG